MNFNFIDEKSLTVINAILLKILSRQGNIFLLETVITIIREIIFNAFKANLKRIYFTKSGIDITDMSTYVDAMEKFKEEFLYNLPEVRPDIETSSYFINTSFHFRNNNLTISVFNNIVILDEEFKRIKDRIEQSGKYETLTDAYDDVYDPTEGAGLGLILMVFLLKNSGIGTKSLKILPGKDGITVSVTIPEKTTEERIVTKVKTKVLADVETLPTFPENIIELQKLCAMKTSTLEEISIKIEHDPALTADVLKLSNSAGFVSGNKISTIKEAVKIIGFKNLGLILTASASRKIMNDRYKKFELIWEHTTRVAYYARLIAKKNNLTSLADSAFISGMLHDIGKIVLLSTDSGIINTISEITKNKQIRSSSVLEEISIGISHAEIGGLIAEKWNFPEDLELSIKNHHSPLNSKKESRDLTFIVYLANMLSGVENKKYNYYYIETEVLKWAGLTTIEEIEGFHNDLKNDFNNHLSVQD